MEYSKVKDAIDSITKAVRKGNYKVSYDDPNFIVPCTAPDGRTFYKLVDHDSMKYSNDFGGCTVEVSGYTFYCDWGNGDYESSFFDEIDEEYDLENGSIVFKDDLIEKIIDTFNDRKDIFFGEYTDMDWQMEMYAKQNGIVDPEYYWWEDDDCPVDINDYTEPKDLGYGTVFIKHRKYYLVEEPDKVEGEQLHAVHCRQKPDDHARFSTVLLELSYKNGKMRIVACNKSDDIYNAVDDCIE